MTKRLWLGGAAILLSSGIALGYAAGRAPGGGVPAMSALTYSGILTDANGAALTGQRGVIVQVWDAATAGAQSCNVGPVIVTLVGGNFQIPLPDTCVTAVHAKADLWVELFVDSVSMGRTKLGAVPYALEAQTASQAAGDLAAQIKTVQDNISNIQIDVTQLKQHPQITVNGKKYSFGAYCGATPATDGLGVGGYSAAKEKCETACGTATAHECSPDEMARTMALGVTVSTVGWVASGAFTYDSSNSNYYVSDCNSYTSNATDKRGSSWNPGASTHGPDWHPCQTSQPILCCD